jgi:hypothetical protein
MTQPNNYVLEGGASNQVQCIIGQKFFLKSDINFIRNFNQFLTIKLNFNQSANVNLNLGSDAYFKNTSCYFKVVALFIRYSFRVRLQYLLLIRSCKLINIIDGRLV